ncbi:flagellin [Lentibacillus sp. N15]|uniref:flagellin n=1 Tax=Lentibacillus songyuanensis TaxID=3136161 RepID=UPI0031BAC491
MQLSDVRTTALGIDDLNVLTRNSAEQAIAKAEQARALVTAERTKYGSYNNALEHIHNNVSNYKGNLTSALSQLRDLMY